MPRQRSASGPVAKFTCFRKLPTELQLLIWSFWRSDQPIICHYFNLSSMTRIYAAYDTSSGSYIRTTVKSAEPDADDPLDPMEYKIRFTNQITTVTGKNIMLRSVFSRGMLAGKGYKTLAPAWAWVNFEKDVFAVANLGHRFPGELRYLFHNIGAKIPRDLPGDHWARRIEKLALRTYENARVLTVLSELDHKALAQLTSLKLVYIVIWACPYCPARSEGPADYEELFVNFDKYHVEHRSPYCRWSELHHDLKSFKTIVKDALKGRSVDVRLVATIQKVTGG